MNGRVLALVRKEFWQMMRDRRTLALMVAIPLLWLVAFGYAVTFDVSGVRLSIVDRSGSADARALRQQFAALPTFTLVPTSARTLASLQSDIRDGTIVAALFIPAGYGTTAVPTLLTDGSDLFSTQAAERAAQSVFARVTQQRVLAGLGLGGLKGGGVAVLSRLAVTPHIVVLYNPSLTSAVVMIPGLIGLVMVFIATLMTALGVVRERERGTLEQLIVTPLRPWEMMVGKVIPYMLVAAGDFVLVLVAGLLLFSVPLRGDLLLLSLASALFLLGALAVGVLISTVSQNQQQAMQLAVFSLLPQFIFSGFIFPLAAMPWGVRWISYLVPLSYFLPVARGVFLKGAGWAALWGDVAVLALFASGALTLASLRFRRQIA